MKTRKLLCWFFYITFRFCNYLLISYILQPPDSRYWTVKETGQNGLNLLGIMTRRLQWHALLESSTHWTLTGGLSVAGAASLITRQVWVHYSQAHDNFLSMQCFSLGIYQHQSMRYSLNYSTHDVHLSVLVIIRAVFRNWFSDNVLWVWFRVISISVGLSKIEFELLKIFGFSM